MFYSREINKLDGRPIEKIYTFNLMNEIEEKILKALDIIRDYSHWRFWAPDWILAKDIYESFPNSYSILTPFAYSYLEEVIRSMTTDYPRKLPNEDGEHSIRHYSGCKLIDLAVKENHEKTDLLPLLQTSRKYFEKSKFIDKGDNRHSVAHGYLPPWYWEAETFEDLILHIAELSPFANF